MLAVFPCLVLLLQLLPLAALDAEQLSQLLTGIVPAAFAEGTGELILTAYGPSLPTLLGISALTLLWAASRGIYGVLTGLNAVYGVPETRGYLRTRLISALYTLVFLLVLLLTFVLQVLAGRLLLLLRQTAHPFVGFLLNLIDLRFFLLLILQTLVFTLMFMVLPARHNSFSESFPGAVLASCGWLVFSDLFSLYVEHFSGGSSVYGSLSALAMGMLWLYCCMSIVFYGGALNVWLKKWK